MRLATYNVENMFDRAKAMEFDTWATGRGALEDFTRLNELIQEPAYTDAVKIELLEIMTRHRGLIANETSTYIVLRHVRGAFIRRRRGKPPEIAASGRDDWTGWFELATGPLKNVAIENTARVIGLLEADALCVVEVESRAVLKRFNQEVLREAKVAPFDHVMAIRGNDLREIDVGIMTKKSCPIVRMLSHVDDEDAKGQIFSRDCVEYECQTPNGNRLLLFVNHFKSKGYGDPLASAAKRHRQAARVRAICDAYLAAGCDLVAVSGDFNEAPDQASLDPLLRDGSTLTDIVTHPLFHSDGLPGTYGSGKSSDKLDYILMSPKLAAKVTAGGVERRGVWGGAKGDAFPHLDTMKRSSDAASDHAALWAEFDL